MNSSITKHEYILIIYIDVICKAPFYFCPIVSGLPL